MNAMRDNRWNDGGYAARGVFWGYTAPSRSGGFVGFCPNRCVGIDGAIGVYELVVNDLAVEDNSPELPDVVFLTIWQGQFRYFANIKASDGKQKYYKIKGL